MNNYVPTYCTEAGVDGETEILLATSGLLADLQACGLHQVKSHSALQPHPAAAKVVSRL